MTGTASPPGDIPPPENLRSRVLSGVAWKVTSQAFLQLSRVLVTVILARLLTPHDYGVAAMVLVFSALAVIFSDLALGAALVQRRTLSEKDRSTVFWLSVGAGAALTALGVILAGPLASFYGEDAVRPLFIVLSLSFFVVALGTTQTALLTREMNFRSLELRMMSGTVVGASTAITVAALGFGAWALVGQQLAQAVVSTTLLWILSPWRPHFCFSLTSLKDLGRFGGNVFLSQILAYVNRSADKILIGRFLGSASLGAYSIAYNIMLIPVIRISAQLQDVLFPALSRLQDDIDRMAAVWLRVTKIVAALVVPAMAGLIVVAPDFVAVVLGTRWNAAVPVLQILAWVGIVLSVGRFSVALLQARDRTGTLLRYMVVSTVAHLGAFAIGLRWGIVGVAASFALVTTLLYPILTSITARAVGLSMWAYIRNLAGVLQATGVMLVCITLARFGLVQAGIGTGLRLAVVVLLGAVTFMAACAWRAPEVAGEVKRLRHTIAVKGRAAAART